MSNFTKEAIKASFIKLLNERPLKQITVKDILEDCGVNRNSFYYHFADIPSLLEEIITGEAARIIAAHPDIGSVEECLRTVLEFSVQNKRAIICSAIPRFNSQSRCSSCSISGRIPVLIQSVTNPKQTHL